MGEHDHDHPHRPFPLPPDDWTEEQRVAWRAAQVEFLGGDPHVGEPDWDEVNERGARLVMTAGIAEMMGVGIRVIDPVLQAKFDSMSIDEMRAFGDRMHDEIQTQVMVQMAERLAKSGDPRVASLRGIIGGLAGALGLETGGGSPDFDADTLRALEGLRGRIEIEGETVPLNSLFTLGDEDEDDLPN